MAGLQIIEQLIMDLISDGDPDRLSNKTPTLSQTSKRKAELRKALQKIKMCP